MKKIDSVLVSKKERDVAKTWMKSFQKAKLPFVKDPVKPPVEEETTDEKAAKN